LTYTDALGLVTTVIVALVAVVLSLFLYRRQTEQGERIGLMVLSAVRTIQRRQPETEVQEEDESPDFSYMSEIEPHARFVKRFSPVSLKLIVLDFNFPAFQCEVLAPDDTKHSSNVIGAESTTLLFPTDFEEADTATAGIYHVRWFAVEQWTKGQQGGESRYHLVDDFFGVLP
jgi:hypothetical protein